jgi:hypothetical protein
MVLRLKRNRPEELDEQQRFLDNAVDDDRPSKRPKNSGRSPSLNGRTMSGPSDLAISTGVPRISKTAARIASKAQKVKGSIICPNQSSRVSKLPPRRSSRIAEREQRFTMTITTPQLPTPLSSTPPKKPKRSSARTTKRGRTRTDGRRHTLKTQGISKTKRRTPS